MYRQRLAEIAADAAQFGRFAASYSAPAGDLRFARRSRNSSALRLAADRAQHRR